jgi:hypothetical protein
MGTANPTEPAPQPEGRSRRRRAALVFLLVLGCGLAAASVVAVWARVTVLNTDRYVSTMAPIAGSRDVQMASLLRGTVGIAIVVAVVIAGLSLLAGKPARRALETAGPRMRAAASGSPAVGWLGEHRPLIQWSVVLLGGLILVAWNDPTAVVVLIHAALIALAVWLVALLAHGGRSATG